MNEAQFEFAPRPSSDFWFTHVDIAVIRDPDLSPRDLQIFCVLCSYADHKLRSWILKVETIAKTAGCDVRTVQTSMKKLIELGLIVKEDRFKNGKQLASLYKIIGHNAPRYKDQDRGENSRTPRGEESCTPTGENSRTPSSREPKELREDSLTGAGKPADRTPTGSGEPAAGEPAPQTPPEEEAAAFDAAPQMTPAEFGAMFEAGAQAMAGPMDVEAQPTGHREERFPVSEAPEVMRSTAEYLLLKTGRSALSEAEISALRTLAARQYPARVQREIDVAAERFKKRGQPLRELTFEYIADALKYQTSRNPRAPAARSAQKSRAPAHDYGPKFEEEAPMTDAEAAYWEAELARQEAEYAKAKEEKP